MWVLPGRATGQQTLDVHLPPAPEGGGEPRGRKWEVQRVPSVGRAFRSDCLLQEAWALRMSRGKAFFFFFFQELGLWTVERLLC